MRTNTHQVSHLHLLTLIPCTYYNYYNTYIYIYIYIYICGRSFISLVFFETHDIFNPITFFANIFFDQTTIIVKDWCDIRALWHIVELLETKQLFVGKSSKSKHKPTSLGAISILHGLSLFETVIYFQTQTPDLIWLIFFSSQSKYWGLIGSFNGL